MHDETNNRNLSHDVVKKINISCNNVENIKRAKVQNYQGKISADVSLNKQTDKKITKVYLSRTKGTRGIAAMENKYKSRAWKNCFGQIVKILALSPVLD